MPHETELPVDAAIVVGIDWGTTRRRVLAIGRQQQALRGFDDDEGLLRSRGRFPAALADALERIAPLAPRARVLLSGMVGSAQGWHEVPYLDAGLPLETLPQQLFKVDDRCAIVPGLRWRGEDGAVDVMRGEETQLLGAVALGHRDGWFVLPGTHSKWVRLRGGCIDHFATYMTGELYALLRAHGTLAPLTVEPDDDDDAFAHGVRASARAALSNVLFGCRARVVTGTMPARAAASYLSGALIGAEWHDALRRGGGPLDAVHVIGEPALAQRHRAAGRLFDVPVHALDAAEVQHAALVALAGDLK